MNAVFLWNYRMLTPGLRPLDVGRGGDCLFKSVSHQLYGDSSHHLAIRNTAVHYLRENPDRFIESVLNRLWSQYLPRKFRQGTWPDHMVIQAVADSFHLRINIVESNEQFLEVTVIQPIDATIQNVRSMYLGHIGEVHYVSTV